MLLYQLHIIKEFNKLETVFVAWISQVAPRAGMFKQIGTQYGMMVVVVVVVVTTMMTSFFKDQKFRVPITKVLMKSLIAFRVENCLTEQTFN